MTQKQINKWLRRRFSAVCWLLIGYFLLMNLLVTAAMLADVLKQSLWSLAAGDWSGTLDTDRLLSNGWGYILTIAVAALILYAWKGPDYWLRDVFQKSKTMSPGIFFSMLALCMGAQMVNSFWILLLEVIANAAGGSIYPLLESVSGSTDSFSMFLYGSVLAPLSEELLFRGYVQRTLRPYGKRFAIFGSALLFGLFHGNLLQTPYAFLMGLLLGWLTEEYSIRWAISLHVFNNLILAEGLGRLSGVMPVMAADILSFALMGTGFVIAIGILIARRRRIREYRHSEWMDRRCVKCLLTNPGFLVLALITAGQMISLMLY